MKGPETSRSLLDRNLFYLYEGLGSLLDRNLFYLYEASISLLDRNLFYLYEGPRDLYRPLGQNLFYMKGL